MELDQLLSDYKKAVREHLVFSALKLQERGPANVEVCQVVSDLVDELKTRATDMERAKQEYSCANEEEKKEKGKKEENPTNQPTPNPTLDPTVSTKCNHPNLFKCVIPHGEVHLTSGDTASFVIS